MNGNASIRNEFFPGEPGAAINRGVSSPTDTGDEFFPGEPGEPINTGITDLRGKLYGNLDDAMAAPPDRASRPASTGMART